MLNNLLAYFYPPPSDVSIFKLRGGASRTRRVGRSLENFDKRLKSRFSECVEHIK